MVEHKEPLRHQVPVQLTVTKPPEIAEHEPQYFRVDEPSKDFRILADAAGRIAKESRRNNMLEVENKKAAHDKLTGLRQRELFEKDAERLRTRALRDGNRMAILLADANNLKEVNDESEDKHSEGDAYLCAIADELTAHLRTTDITGRWGGDEFVAAFPVMSTFKPEILPDLQNELKRRINEGVEERLSRPNAISVGITFWEPGQSLIEAIKAADKLMYEDKQTFRESA